MATEPVDMTAWIPEEIGGPVITKVKETSAVEGLARQEPMTSLTKKVPRDGGVSFEGATPKSTVIAKDQSEADTVLLTARKFTRIVEFPEEDIADTSTVANVVQTKQLAWATSYGKGLDNSCLAVTGAENGTTVPFTSLYRVLTSADAGLPEPEANYGANDNVVVSASGGMTYSDLSDLFGLVEQGDWYEDGSMIVIAHPSFRAAFRGLLDADGRPLFQENQQRTNGDPDMLWGLPVKWTLGARTSPVATDKPQGKPLLFVGNKNMLIFGPRSGPEYMFAGADSGPAFETDDAMLKFRRRAGFTIGHPRAFAMLVGN
jgi:HK97 family phage major capsid protein